MGKVNLLHFQCGDVHAMIGKRKLHDSDRVIIFVDAPHMQGKMIDVERSPRADEADYVRNAIGVLASLYHGIGKRVARDDRGRLILQTVEA